MKFSIATPSYNSMPALRNCVGSIRGQSVDCIIEHHVQDGGSSDGATDFLQKYTLDVSNISDSSYHIEYASEPDNGMYDAINKAWGKSNGDILAWLNSDEQYLPGTLQMIADYFAGHPDVDVVWGEFICVNKTGDPVALRRDIPARKFYMQNCRCYIASCTAFYRRKLWDSGLLRLDDTYRFSADRDLYLRLIRNGVKFVHLPVYVSVFELADQNLSVKHYEEMYREYQQISREHGGGGRAVQLVAKVLRGMERLFRGCYFSRSVEFDYVLDELGETQRKRARHISYKMDYSGGS